jgi:hypothetical protein
MINFSKITANVLVAVLSLNAVAASAQSVSSGNQSAQGRVVQGKHFPKATIVMARDVAAPATSDQTQDAEGRGKINVQNITWGGGHALRLRAASGINIEAASATAVPVPTAQIPDAPCGPVATNPNSDVVASSTTC